MSEFNTEDITDRAGTGKPDLTFGFKINGSDSGINPFLHTESANEPSNPNNGDAWFDTANNIYKVYINNEWKDWFGTTAAPRYGDRAFKTGNVSGGSSNRIEYWSMTSAGNAADFGDLTITRNQISGMTNNSAYAFCVAGASGGTEVKSIDYWASATTGNASDFGDLTKESDEGTTNSDGTTACTVIGRDHSGGSSYTLVNIIEKFTMSTPGNSTDFGDLLAPLSLTESCANDTRMIISGGYNSGNSPPYSNVIQYITPATPGNSTDFGDLTTVKGYHCGAGTGNADRGLFMGGYYHPGDTFVQAIDYIDVTSAGNAADFGDLLEGCQAPGGCSNATKAHCFGGYATGSINGSSNRIQEVTMATLGNATDFGDLLSGEYYCKGTSGAAS